MIQKIATTKQRASLTLIGWNTYPVQFEPIVETGYFVAQLVRPA
jgi:hypothetical protein